MRMDRYKDYDEKEALKKEESDQVLSRELKNQEMYKDVYMNNTFVDINKIFSQDEEESPIPETSDIYEEEKYEEKSYDINEYLEKAHEKHEEDNAMRNLNVEEFMEQEDEIRKLLLNIDEKAEEDDFLKDLRGDNEDTMIGGKLKTDEFDTSIFKTLREDEIALHEGNTILQEALGDETFAHLAIEEDNKLDHTFEKIIESDKKNIRKKKRLPLIIFLITLIMLIVVIIVIVLK